MLLDATLNPAIWTLLETQMKLEGEALNTQLFI